MRLVAPIYYDYGTLYGAYLIFTLGCTYYAIYKWKKENQVKDQKFSKWHESWPKIFAFLVVAGLFWFQNNYRFHYSFEVSAMKTLDNILDAWEMGDKEIVINTLEGLSSEQRPWHPEPDSFQDPY